MPEEIKNQTQNYPEDVQIVRKDGREFIIVGTAHISRHSADLVRDVIEKEKPDVVCVELDEKRKIGHVRPVGLDLMLFAAAQRDQICHVGLFHPRYKCSQPRAA